MLAGVPPKLLQAQAEAMRYFGLIAANMMCGRLMRQATSSQVLKLSYGKMKKSLALILTEMVTQV